MDRISLLRMLDDPNRAWLVLLVGLALIYRECLAPGRVLPGVLGGVAVCVSIYSLFQHPWSGQALVLILAGVALLTIQVFGRYLWIPGIFAALLITAGVHQLTDPPIGLLPAGLSIPLSGITIFLLKTAVRARRNKVSLQ
ncbi:MAG TPA: hypothetical protein VEX68_28640 [Bryobacteraceae bacterium]|nr:hypothetical protein [Bryobacteraceae bacterium]